MAPSTINRGNAATLDLEQSLQPTGSKMRIHVAGWVTCPFFAKAVDVTSAMTHLYPDKFDHEVFEFADRDAFRKWLGEMNPKFRTLLASTPNAATHTSSPFVWSNTSGYMGGCDALLAFFREQTMPSVPPPAPTSAAAAQMVAAPIKEEEKFDYDLVVIGGGSGGLACSKEAAKFGAKVCVLDYVKPSPQGTSWGLGGTCVNVGCIPKKLMHTSALMGEMMHRDAKNFGWNTEARSFDWQQMVESVDNHIKGLNFKYKVDLRSKQVKYENFLGSFVDAHTIELTHPKKASKTIRTKHAVVAVGGRPKQLECEGGLLAITSDDIFWKKTPPGKTLVIGASYVALECAGFLKGLGYDVKIMVRSILLRGFDQDMANRIGEYMENECEIPFLRETIPKSITKLDDGRLLVKWQPSGDAGSEGEEIFDTVLNATGRAPDLEKLGLEKVGVALNPKSGRILQKYEQTNIPNIFAIGDVIDGPELTPVAIQAGRYLARRLFNSENVFMDYDNICTSVFTPIEYGSCGLSEEKSLELLGEENVEIYHQSFTPLEWALSSAERPNGGSCYVKVICDKRRDLKVVGFHYLGPNAGEVTQAIGIAMKVGFTYAQMVDTVGIHPTTAETFTTLEVTKSSGKSAAAAGC